MSAQVEELEITDNLLEQFLKSCPSLLDSPVFNVPQVCKRKRTRKISTSAQNAMPSAKPSLSLGIRSCLNELKGCGSPIQWSEEQEPNSPTMGQLTPPLSVCGTLKKETAPLPSSMPKNLELLFAQVLYQNNTQPLNVFDYPTSQSAVHRRFQEHFPVVLATIWDVFRFKSNNFTGNPYPEFSYKEFTKFLLFFMHPCLYASCDDIDSSPFLVREEMLRLTGDVKVAELSENICRLLNLFIVYLGKVTQASN